MKNKNTLAAEDVGLDMEVQELADVLASETIAILKSYKNTKKIDIESTALSLYLASLMSMLIDNALSDEVITGNTNRKRYNQASKSFSDLKSNIEFSISQGFQEGLSTFSGVPVSYQCVIKPVEQPINKLMM